MGGVAKQFRMLGGRPLWRWSADVAERLHSMGLVDELIVVFPQNCDLGAIKGLHDMKCPVVFASGGKERTRSVLNGLLASSSEFVMIHDAARPFLDVGLCRSIFEGTSGDRGVIPLLPSVDSLKGLDGGVISVIPRETVFRTQTPQAFRRETLIRAIEDAGVATDEAALWLEAAKELAWTPGDEKNFKITTEFDWLAATSLVNAARETRTGFGYDVHELVPGRRLVLGGLEIPSELGLLGHSDADVLCHAMADALLGAAGLGDIGALFPASDERYKDMDSTIILGRVLEILAQDGWSVGWIDATLIAQVPRLGPLMSKITSNLGRSFAAYNLIEKINLKVKSGEFVGGVGRAECMECNVLATIERFGREILGK
jgi:2-C-methyl-D-erythritol 4-phosphate cytidylyltransferase/2-C-methyl-D-erythritol 2,4-cyclodiphosphate synthase